MAYIIRSSENGVFSKRIPQADEKSYVLHTNKNATQVHLTRECHIEKLQPVIIEGHAADSAAAVQKILNVCA